jgi:type IV pilus assembly protein PilM
VFGGARKFVTGLDVGSESVKAVRLLHTGDSMKIAGLALTEIKYPSQIRGEGDPGARKARIDAIKSALRSSGTDVSRPCRVVTAVAGPGVSVKHVTFPKMSNPSLAESIGWEAKKHVPFGASEFVLDFQPLARDAADGADEMHVLLAAVEKRHMDAHVGLVCDAGVEPDAVDLAPLAMMNEVEAEGLLGDSSVASVEIGCCTLSMSIYKAGGLLLVRSVNVPPTMGGAPGATKAREGEAGGEEPPDSRRAWQGFVLKEVQRSLAFYNTETGRHGIEKIYLGGGRALAADITERFKSALSIPTETLRPFDGVGSSIGIEAHKDQGPRFALAMSLARRR